MADKKLVNLYISTDVIAFYTEKARQDLLEEGEMVGEKNLQKRRSRLMIEVLTTCYETEEEDE